MLDGGAASVGYPVGSAQVVAVVVIDLRFRNVAGVTEIHCRLKIACLDGGTDFENVGNL